MARTIYADTDHGRMGATLDAEEGTRVLVHIVGRGMLGWYSLERFDGGKVTPRSIAALFAKPTA